MGKTLFFVGLTLCSLAASPPPTTKPALPYDDGQWLRDYARRFGNPPKIPTSPTTRSSMRDPIDGMPNAIPRRFDPGMLPLSPRPQRPATNPWFPNFNPPSGLRAIPPDCQRFKFNGEDVYIIPLKERAVEMKVGSR